MEQKDSIDLICEQIEKVVRMEVEGGSGAYWAYLKDGELVFFGGMNSILRRFIFDNRYSKRTSVDFTGQTTYAR